MARFALQGLRSAVGLARSLGGERARALFAGNAAHSFLALEDPGTAAFGLLLSVAGHAVGWPIARGGSQRVADALAAYFRSLGGEIVTSAPVEHLDELRPARAILLDVSPRQVLRLAGDAVPSGYRRVLERYRYGAAAFKLDWALDGPVPWKAPECARAATVHLGGTLEEVAASEATHTKGREVHERPFVLFVQPTLFDPSRAPAGKHTAWAYCHVPNGFTGDLTDRLERQVERFAPGFRERILARSVHHAGRPRAAQREPDRGRHQRRDDGPAAGVRAAGRAADAVSDADEGRVSLLGLYAAGWWGARDVRLPRRSGGAFGYWTLAGFFAWLGAVMDSPRRHEGDEELRAYPNRRLIPLQGRSEMLFCGCP